MHWNCTAVSYQILLSPPTRESPLVSQKGTWNGTPIRNVFHTHSDEYQRESYRIHSWLFDKSGLFDCDRTGPRPYPIPQYTAAVPVVRFQECIVHSPILDSCVELRASVDSYPKAQCANIPPSRAQGCRLARQRLHRRAELRRLDLTM